MVGDWIAIRRLLQYLPPRCTNSVTGARADKDGAKTTTIITESNSRHVDSPDRSNGSPRSGIASRQRTWMQLLPLRPPTVSVRLAS